MDKTVGFLGCGNMGERVLAGMLASQIIPPSRICVKNRSVASSERIRDKYGVHLAAAADELALKCDIIVIGVEPDHVASVLADIAPAITAQTLVVSIAAGVTLETMALSVPHGSKLVRVMPNLATQIGCGVVAVCHNRAVTPDDAADVVKLFSALGKVYRIEEKDMHAFIALCGSSPAYVYMFISAMCDAGVFGGLPRPLVQDMAAQAVVGSAKLMQETGKSPDELKNMVTSPGGTTIEAVRRLEQGGLRSTVIEAMIACMDKSRLLSNKKGDDRH